MALTESLADQIAAVRQFNRFYTRTIGVLHEHWLDSSLSLPEARLLYEIAHRGESRASELGAELRLDAGYLSRLVAKLEDRGLLRRRVADADRRQSLLTLTKKGRDQLAPLDREASARVQSMLEKLTVETRSAVVQAMETIERAVGETSDSEPYILRNHRPGDIGWVLQRNVETYAREYGWGGIEKTVAEIVTDFVRSYDPARERCWIVERRGERLGCVFLVKHPDEKDTAKLRLLYVESSARGLGLGQRLVAECTRFARETGYSKITLWTHSVLTAARKLYEREGYRLVAEERHSQFGPEVLGQTWELKL